MNSNSFVAILSVVMIGSAFAPTKSAESVTARLQKVEDRLAIEQLLMGDYPRALDSNDWAAYAALFAVPLDLKNSIAAAIATSIGPGE